MQVTAHLTGHFWQTVLMFILTALLALASPDLTLEVAASASPAVVEVPLDSLLWVNIAHPSGPAEAVAEILGDDLMHCANLTSPLGFRPAHRDQLWGSDLLRYAVIEVSAEAISVSGQEVVRLDQGRVPQEHKHGVVIRPLLEILLTQHEAQHQFANACEHPPYEPGGPPTSAANARLLLAVAPDVPFDLVNEVLLTARKARFKYFYLYATAKRVLDDPLRSPPALHDAGIRVYVASDGGLGIDSETEGTDKPSGLVGYLPTPSSTPHARVVPYPASPFGAVAGAAGALLAKGWTPAVLPRLSADDLRKERQPPKPKKVTPSKHTGHVVTAIPLLLPEGDPSTARASESQRTRFSITGSTPHVATFTPPAHVADALNTPEMGAQLKKVLTCYRDEEEDKPGMVGDLVLELRVGPAGRPASLSWLPTSTLEDRNLRECVHDVFMALDLPRAAVTPEPMLWRVSLHPEGG